MLNTLNGNRNDTKHGKGTCSLYEETRDKQHYHDNSHATGAIDIENNQYQEPPEEADKIILKHTVMVVKVWRIRSFNKNVFMYKYKVWRIRVF